MKLRHAFVFFLCFIASTSISFSQDFINGDFEDTEAVVDMINLTNPIFNDNMANVTAYGSFGNMDIISSATWGGSGAQSGEWYVSLTGDGTDGIAIELTSPLVTGESYTFSFWDRADPGYIALPITIGASTSSTDFGTEVYTADVAATNNVWTERVFTFVAPNDASYITVEQFGGATGNWVHVDNFSTNCNLQIDLGDDIVACAGDEIILDATTDDVTYEWSDASTDPTLTVAESGTYSVTISDENCDVTDVIEITVYEDPVLELNDTEISCSGDPIILEVVSDQVDVTYLWSDMSENSTLEVSTAGDYTVIVTNPGGCSSEATASVSFEITNLEVSLENVMISCDEVLEIIPDIDAVDGDLSYEWTIDEMFAGDDAVLVYDQNQAAEIELTVTDACGNVESAAMTLTIEEVDLDLELGDDLTVGCLENFNIEPEITGGSGAITYQWFVNETEESSDPIFSYQTSQSIEVSLVVADACGNSDEDDVLVLLNVEPLTLTPIEDQVICLGEQVFVEALVEGGAGAYAYQWNGEAGTAQYSDAPSSSESVTLLVADACGSEIEDAFFIEVIDLNVSIQFEMESSTTVQFESLIEPNCEQCVFEYDWDFGDGSNSSEADPLHSFIEFGMSEGSLTIEDENGCSAIAFFNFQPPPILFVPNAFTPNNDGVNDYFQVIGEGIKEFHIVIFNRWGEIVYESYDLSDRWLGEVNSGEYYAPDNVYNYLIEVEPFNVESYELNGTITVVR